MLRQLAQYHAKDSNALFMVRLAQGLTHLGKGTLTLQPYHSERQLMNPVAVAGLLSTVVACLDVKNSNLSLFFVFCCFPCRVDLMIFNLSWLLCNSSYFEQIALLAVHIGGITAAANAHHVRRGTAAIARFRSSRPGCRRGRSGGQTENNHGLSDAHDARPLGSRRTCRTGHRGLCLSDAHHGRLCHPEKEDSWMIPLRSSSIILFRFSCIKDSPPPPSNAGTPFIYYSLLLLLLHLLWLFFFSVIFLFSFSSSPFPILSYSLFFYFDRFVRVGWFIYRESFGFPQPLIQCVCSVEMERGNCWHTVREREKLMMSQRPKKKKE